MFDYPEAASIGAFVTRVALGSAGDRDAVVAAVDAIRDRDGCAETLHAELFALPVFDVERHRALICVIGQLAHSSSLAALERFVWLSPDRVLPSRSVLWEGFTTTDWSLQARAAQMLAWVAREGYRDTQLQIVRGHPHASVRYAAIGAWLLARADDPDAKEKLCALVASGDKWAVTNADTIAALPPRQFTELVNAQALLTA
jgi:hypothetical protein